MKAKLLTILLAALLAALPVANAGDEEPAAKDAAETVAEKPARVEAEGDVEVEIEKADPAKGMPHRLLLKANKLKLLNGRIEWVPGKMAQSTRITPWTYRVVYGSLAAEQVLKDLRATLKTLRAAGLEKEAKAVEAEIARREAARKPLTYLANANLTTSIAALRADVAALRKEVRELTTLVRKLAEEE